MKDASVAFETQHRSRRTAEFHVGEYIVSNEVAITPADLDSVMNVSEHEGPVSTA